MNLQNWGWELTPLGSLKDALRSHPFSWGHVGKQALCFPAASSPISALLAHQPHTSPSPQGYPRAFAHVAFQPLFTQVPLTPFRDLPSSPDASSSCIFPLVSVWSSLWIYFISLCFSRSSRKNALLFGVGCHTKTQTQGCSTTEFHPQAFSLLNFETKSG